MRMQIIPVDPLHTLEILKEDFLEEYGVSAYKATDDMSITRTRIERVLRGENGITADTALRLSRYFGNSPAFWLDLPRSYDPIARKATGDLSGITPGRAA
jgi:addiction module HigA family antidote